MITARLATYSREEAELLKEILDESIVKISSKVCFEEQTNVECKKCPYRHVCEDVSRVYDYLVYQSTFGYPAFRK